MRISVYDLAFQFIEDFYGDVECPEDIKHDIIVFMDDLLWDGFTAEEIVARWNNYQKHFSNQMPKLKSLYKAVPKEKNLLKPGKFYYHNLLQIVPGPPVRDLDLNTGEIKKLDEPYFLEMRASLTIDQLTDYYIEQNSLGASENDEKRIAGSFRYLLKEHDVEALLFMIDVGANLAKDMDMPLVQPIDLPKLREQAKDAWAAKVTEIRQEGDEQVVPRKRILSSRSRRQETEREIHPQYDYSY